MPVHYIAMGQPMCRTQWLQQQVTHNVTLMSLFWLYSFLIIIIIVIHF